jgi:hypothetical protein
MLRSAAFTASWCKPNNRGALMSDETDDQTLQQLRELLARRQDSRTRSRLVAALAQHMARLQAAGRHVAAIAIARERVELLRVAVRQSRASPGKRREPLLNALLDLARLLGDLSDVLDAELLPALLHVTLAHRWGTSFGVAYDRIEEAYAVYRECATIIFETADDRVTLHDANARMSRQRVFRPYAVLHPHMPEILMNLARYARLVGTWEQANGYLELIIDPFSVRLFGRVPTTAKTIIGMLVLFATHRLERLRLSVMQPSLYTNMADGSLDWMLMPARAESGTLQPSPDVAAIENAIDAAIELLDGQRTGTDWFVAEPAEALELRCRALQARARVARRFSAQFALDAGTAATFERGTASLHEAVELAHRLVAQRGSDEDVTLCATILFDMAWEEYGRDDEVAAAAVLDEIIALYRTRAATIATPHARNQLAMALTRVRRAVIARLARRHVGAEWRVDDDRHDAHADAADSDDDDEQGGAAAKDDRAGRPARAPRVPDQAGALDRRLNRERNAHQLNLARARLQDSLDESLNLLREVAAERGTAEDWRALLRCIAEQAEPWFAGSDVAPVRQAYDECIAIRRAQLAEGVPHAARELGLMLSVAARARQRCGDAAAAGALLDEALAALRQLAHADDTPADWFALAQALRRAAHLATERGDAAAALACATERLSAMCEVVRRRGRPIDRRTLVAAAEAALTSTLAADPAASPAAVLAQARTALRAHVGAGGGEDLLNLLYLLARTARQHEPDAALDAAHEALAWCQHDDLARHRPGSRAELGRAWFVLAEVQHAAQAFAPARHSYQQSVAAWRSLAYDQPRPGLAAAVALALRQCGTCAAALGDDAAALAWFDESRRTLTVQRNLLVEHVIQRAGLWYEICSFHRARRQLAAAQAAARMSLKLWRFVTRRRYLPIQPAVITGIRRTLREIIRQQIAASGAAGGDAAS